MNIIFTLLLLKILLIKHYTSYVTFDLHLRHYWSKWRFYYL